MVFKVANGKYRVQVWVGGKRQSFYFTHKRDAEAKEALLKRERELIRAGLERPHGNVLFIDIASEFIFERKKSRPRSYPGDESKLRLYWVPKFGTSPAALIRKEMIENALDELQDQHQWSAATRNRHRALLHTLFGFAMDSGAVSSNPVSRIKLRSEQRGARRTAYLSDAADCERLIAAAYRRSEDLGCLFTVLVFAGPRVSEALALGYEDIDWDGSAILIRKTLNRDGTVFYGTKGQREGGHYVLPLFPRVKSALARLLGNRRPDRLFKMTYYSVRAQHDALMAETGIPRVTHHDLRRTFASHAERAGFSRGDVQTMLGHSSIVTTEKYIRKNVAHLVAKAEEVGFASTKTAPRKSASRRRRA